MKFVNINNIDKIKWNDFVLNHPNGNFFQTYDYFDLQTKCKLSEPVGYAVIVNDEIAGLIVGVILKNYFWPVNIFTKRLIVMGGPLIKNDKVEVFDFLINNFCSVEKQNSVYVQFRNLWKFDKAKFDFIKYGFFYEEHLDIIHDLTIDKNQISKNISKSKRGNINKSINKGTIVREIYSFDEYIEGVKLITLTYKRIGLPCPEDDYFINAYNLYNDSGKIKSFGAFVENELIAMRIEICYKNTIYDWYTGDKAGFNNRYPNDLLPYNILLWGKENGYKIFDFGGAGKPGISYGVREHKLKFGGSLVEYGRYKKINNRLLMWIFNFGMLFKKKK